MPTANNEGQNRRADYRVAVIAIFCGFIASVGIGRLAAVTERFVLDHTTPVVVQAHPPARG